MPKSGSNPYIEAVKTLLAVLALHEPDLKNNSERIAKMAQAFAKKLSLDKAETDAAYLGGLLHDIGMIHVPAEILQKNAALIEEEMKLVKQHPALSSRVLSNLKFLRGVLPVVRHHHEAYNGTGYPDGLQGDKIPQGARLLALVESYDAIVSGRCYRDPKSTDEALKEINDLAGKQFDGRMIKDFTEFVKLYAATEAAAERRREAKKKDTIREMIEKIILRFKDGKIVLPAVPKVVQDIQRAMKDPDITTDKLAKVIERDAVISVRLITISNSATYRGTDKIQTVKQAVPRLGMKQAQSVVTAIASKGMYDVENEQFKEVLQKLWMHALATAYAARNLAVRVGLDDVEMLFLMGLVHDIGKVLLLKPLSELVDKAEVINMDEALTTIQVSHAHLGGSLLERLGFSQEVVRTTTMHNAKKFSDATQREILAVNLANLLAHKLGYTIWDEEEVELEQLESAKILALAPQALTDVCGEVKKIMDDAAQSF